MNLKEKIPGANSFTYREFVKSDTAIRYRIDNTPTENQWKKIEILASRVLQPIRDKFGPIKITSGFRCVDLCLLIKSSSLSNHTKGEAADIEPIDPSITLIEMAEWIYENLEFRTLIMEYYPEGWIHVDYREGANIKKLQLKDNTHDYQEVTIAYLKDICS